MPAARLPRWVNPYLPRGFAPRTARRYTKPLGSPLLTTGTTSAVPLRGVNIARRLGVNFGRRLTIKCRRAALQQLYNTIVAAPEEVRDQVRNLTRMRRLRTCAAWWPDAVGYRDPVVATKLSLKSLARRILDLNDEIAELDRFIVPLVEELAPSLLELEGVGTENAGAVMVAVGDNPDRLRSEASFAMMCGVCPIPASSGKT